LQLNGQDVFDAGDTDHAAKLSSATMQAGTA
jgi:hypothetical protein